MEHNNTPKPHIILILSDQHNGNILGCRDNPIVRTPNIDRLAGSGVQYTQCSCSSPLCVPSRSSLLTGKYPIRTGVFTNHQALPSHFPTFVHGLRNAGYQTVLCGRMHFLGPDQRHGYERRLVGDMCPTSFGSPFASRGYLSDAMGQNRASAEKSGPGNSSVIRYDREVTDAACRFIEEYPNDGAPLFLTVGFYEPHNPFVCPPELYQYYYPKIHLSCDHILPSPLHPAIEKWLTLRGIRELDDQVIRRVRAAYFGKIEMLDGNIGAVMNAAEKALDPENTIFVYASDHGDMAGSRQMFWKSSLYEGAVNVPLILSGTPVFSSGGTVTEPVSLLDLGPTLLEIAGSRPLPRPDGLSLTRLPGVDRYVFSFLGDDKGDPPAAMIRKGEWKLIRYSDIDSGELYNLSVDPEERNNLYGVTRCEDIRQDLEEKLFREWNGKQISEIIRTSNENKEYFREYVNRTGAENPEYWLPREDENYILE